MSPENKRTKPEEKKAKPEEKQQAHDHKLQEKYSYVLGLMNTTLGGEVFSDESGNYEIIVKNSTRNFLTTILISTSGNKKTLTISSSFKSGNYPISQNTYRDIDKLYISIVPGTEVAFLVMCKERFQVVFVNRDAKVTSLNGKEKRKENDNVSDEKMSHSKFKEMQRKRNQKNKRRIFVTF